MKKYVFLDDQGFPMIIEAETKIEASSIGGALSNEGTIMGILGEDVSQIEVENQYRCSYKESYGEFCMI